MLNKDFAPLSHFYTITRLLEIPWWPEMREAGKIPGRKKKKLVLCEIEVGKNQLHLSGLKIFLGKSPSGRA